MSESLNNKLEDKLAKRNATGLERVLPHPKVSNGMVNLANNDYFGLAQHPKVKEAAKQAIEEYGCSSSASPLISGFGQPHYELQERLLDWYGADSVIIWNSGYIANQALFSLLPGKGDYVFADELVHHSVIAGLLKSKAKFRRFPHLDHDRLEEWLLKTQGSGGTTFVVTESVFSMDGDSPNLIQLAELRERYEFAWIVDEAHAIGWYGGRGTGLLEEQGLSEFPDAVLGTLGKALGSQGAYLILRNEAWKRYLINFAGEFIYSTYLTPAAAASASQSIELMPEYAAKRPLWKEGSIRFRKELTNGGWQVPAGDSPVVPLLVGEIPLTVKMAEQLRSGGIFAGMVRPPTVPTGTSRVRFSLKADLDFSVIAERIAKLLGVPAL